ncbi:hypothetical protein NP493_111g00034 [Ridgeia piscesae]|uniref:Uncharacterized protein n=1 Tax=Ridgeia piscesae TaxID=27915 RepID=A0AAD9UH29_RIDPI|nr:hypothetical protein NP493_111g00034 [Ridgeia piscesae]
MRRESVSPCFESSLMFSVVNTSSRVSTLLIFVSANDMC